MSALEAMTVAIEMAERKRDQARQALRDRHTAYQAAQAQMQQLQSYEQELQQRWGATEGGSFNPEVMLHYRQFTERLQHAIGLQTKVIADQAIRLEAAQKALLAAELRLGSLNKVVQARRRSLELAQMRREQKQSDERAALQFIGRTLGVHMQEATP